MALGAGIAFAPFAIAAASADPGQAAQGPAAAAAQQGPALGQPARAAQPMRVAEQAVAKVVLPAPAAPPAPAAAALLVPVKPAVKVPNPVQSGSVAAQSAAQPVALAERQQVAPRSQAADRRSIVVIGASVSAGKAVTAGAAYPGQVRELSGRPVYVSARSGAAYNDGSIAQLTRAANLPARSPALVVLQAGTNDVGARPAAVAGQVRQVVSTVRQQAPGAKIALVTVFPSIHSGEAAQATDQAIIGAAQSVDPSVTVISPLEEEWRYGASGDGHPGSSAHLRIAERISALV
ncbi:hypothetical protein GCM10027289_17190 [Tsukamurella serpentis]